MQVLLKILFLVLVSSCSNKDDRVALLNDQITILNDQIINYGLKYNDEKIYFTLGYWKTLTLIVFFKIVT